MQPKLIIVAGLPGSGKTTYLNKLKKANKIEAFYDDFQADAPEDDPNPYLSKYFTATVSDLRHGKTVAAADIRYVIPKELDLLKQAIASAVPNTIFDVRIFKNEPVKCRANVLARGDKFSDWSIKLIDEYTDCYKLPSGVVTMLKVFAKGVNN